MVNYFLNKIHRRYAIHYLWFDKCNLSKVGSLNIWGMWSVAHISNMYINWLFIYIYIDWLLLFLYILIDYAVICINIKLCIECSLQYFSKNRLTHLLQTSSRKMDVANSYSSVLLLRQKLTPLFDIWKWK